MPVVSETPAWSAAPPEHRVPSARDVLLESLAALDVPLLYRPSQYVPSESEMEEARRRYPGATRMAESVYGLGRELLTTPYLGPASVAVGGIKEVGKKLAGMAKKATKGAAHDPTRRELLKGALGAAAAGVAGKGKRVPVVPISAITPPQPPPYLATILDDTARDLMKWFRTREPEPGVRVLDVRRSGGTIKARLRGPKGIEREVDLAEAVAEAEGSPVPYDLGEIATRQGMYALGDPGERGETLVNAIEGTAYQMLEEADLPRATVARLAQQGKAWSERMGKAYQLREARSRTKEEVREWLRREGTIRPVRETLLQRQNEQLRQQVEQLRRLRESLEAIGQVGSR